MIGFFFIDWFVMTAETKKNILIRLDGVLMRPDANYAIANKFGIFIHD